MIFAGSFGIRAFTASSNKIDYLKTKERPETPVDRFSPSNAKTTDGEFIRSDDFFPASRCANCHQETHAQWSESLHRNAGREPFYKESVNILERQRGIEFTQHCESCHSPISLLSGALITGSKESRDMDDEGVTCTVCHSITEARLDGTGSYTIRRPSLLIGTSGSPIYDEVTDKQILADIPNHKKAVMNDVLRTPEFCATCHKAAAPPELNGYKYLRGFNAYDEWQMSGASKDTITPYYRRDNRTDCKSCHMPLTGEGKRDLAADEKGLVASHRFLGANTATPMFYGQDKQVELTKKFLQDNVLSVDIFSVKNETSGQGYSALKQNSSNVISFSENQEITAEVVIFNRKAAHSFPPELRDLYEPWVEFEAIDAAGKKIFHSGFVKPDKSVDESSHVYKSILLDANSRSITRHQVWLSAIKAYDNFIPAGRGDIARYRFRIPGEVGEVTLKAKINYRRFIQDYTNFVLAKHPGRELEIPIVKMAETSLILKSGNDTYSVRKADNENDDFKTALRWNDYGISLLEQSQASEAANAFREAMRLDSKNPDYPASAAVAEIRMERYAFGVREQIEKAESLLATSLRISPGFPRARFYQALIFRSKNDDLRAEKILIDLASKYPRDREVLRQLGQTQFNLGKIKDARKSFESIVSIDPTDANSWQFLEPIYAAENNQEQSERAHRLYLLWRDDPNAEVVATKFFAFNPNWSEVRIPTHFYSADSALRPTASGFNAAPDK